MLEKLCKDIRFKVSSYISLNDLHKLKAVSKFYKIRCEELIYLHLKLLFKPIQKHFRLNFSKCPFFQERREQGANTSYIDTIKVSNVTNKVTVGLDIFQRPFVAFRLRIHDTKRKHEIVNTLFQRYSYDRNKWVFGTAYSLRFLFSKRIPTARNYATYNKLTNNHIVFSEKSKLAATLF